MIVFEAHAVSGALCADMTALHGFLSGFQLLKNLPLVSPALVTTSKLQVSLEKKKKIASTDMVSKHMGDSARSNPLEMYYFY